MLKGHYTYLILNIVTIFFPLVLSFDKKVAFFKKWKFFVPAMIVTGAIFIIWDVWFTKIGVWSFNPSYLIGLNIANLPIEEWLFFITVPYACVFIYECLKCWFNISLPKLLTNLLTFGGILLLLVVAALNYDKAYTSITFTLLAFFLFLQRLLFKNQVERNFYPAYTIALLPFLIVNGILTANPVVIYNDAENLGFRLHTIPFEDIWYGMLLILMNITFLELFRNKRNLKLQK